MMSAPYTIKSLFSALTKFKQKVNEHATANKISTVCWCQRADERLGDPPPNGASRSL